MISQKSNLTSTEQEDRGEKDTDKATSPTPQHITMNNYARCGCDVVVDKEDGAGKERRKIRLLSVDARTKILATSSKTTLTQTFENPGSARPLEELRYVFPLYEGVSVVSFTAYIGSQIINGVVEEKSKATQAYREAKSRGEVAGLLEQSLRAGDVFITKIGNGHLEIPSPSRSSTWPTSSMTPKQTPFASPSLPALPLAMGQPSFSRLTPLLFPSPKRASRLLSMQRCPMDPPSSLSSRHHTTSPSRLEACPTPLPRKSFP